MPRNTDRISSLPDELLADILSVLPTKCAIGTSTLSKRWKCLYMFTNCLSFQAPWVVGEEDVDAERKSFRTFVNKVVSTHRVSPIKSFQLDCGKHAYVTSRLHTWIGFALSKGVEQLYLFLGPRPQNALPDGLFNCRTIVELKIESKIEDLHVPEAIHLPNLKILYFKRVRFVDYDSLARFLSACPLLQELIMKHCTCSNQTDHHVRVFLGELKWLTMSIHDGSFEIDSPKLVYLNMTWFGKGYIVLSLKNPQCLVTAHLNFCLSRYDYEFEHGLVLLKAVHHVKELHLGMDAVMCHFPEDFPFPSYPNLEKLSIGPWTYNHWTYVRHLLVNSPRLETVVFDQIISMLGVSKREDKWPADVELAPFSSCVKVIESSKFLGYSLELVFLKHLLGNANELNMLILTSGPSCYTTQKEILEARKELFNFPRASETCDIQLREAPKIEWPGKRNVAVVGSM